MCAHAEASAESPPTSDHVLLVLLVGVGCVFCGRLYGNGLLDGTFLEANIKSVGSSYT